MNQPSENAWKPDAELLAAYFDGELEGRDELADMRTRIEAWLDANPAAEQWIEHQQLQKLWHDTTPAEPGPATWRQTLERIDEGRKLPASAPASRRSWMTAGIVAASVVLFVGLVLGGLRSMLTTADPVVKLPPVKTLDDVDVEMLLVASAEDVTILRIEGADFNAVVVGTMPVNGPLELADSGEVCISCKCPRVAVRQEHPHRPMVWAVANAE